MLSFLTRSSFVLPLLCALAVSAKYTIKSVKNDLIVAPPFEKEVKIVLHKAAAAELVIDPSLDEEWHVGPRTIKYKHHDDSWYIGKHHDSDTLVWVSDKYNWRIVKVGEKYILSRYDEAEFWFDHNDDDTKVGTIELKDATRFHDKDRYLWEIKDTSDD